MCLHVIFGIRGEGSRFPDGLWDVEGGVGFVCVHRSSYLYTVALKRLKILKPVTRSDFQLHAS